jgi:hypothetical protein
MMNGFFDFTVDAQGAKTSASESKGGK